MNCLRDVWSKKLKKKILRALTETAILPRTGSGIQPYWSREPPEKKMKKIGQ